MRHVSRIGAVLWTDLLIRIRKPSTLVSFLLLCFVAYLWVPDPDSGLALMTFAKQRVLYNSPAMAFATAVLGSVSLVLLGFYLVSHSISHDVRTRCGQVIAATPTTNWEYLIGKFLGNIAFLSLLTAGYLLSSIVMQGVRGEAPLDLGAYFSHYLMMLPPPIVFVSSVALLFESIPRLAGKLGDVLYFFLWGLILSLPVGLGSLPGGNPAMYFDFTGMALVEQGLLSQPGAESVSIGVSPFDPDLGVRVWDGIEMQRSWIVSRIVSVLASLPLLALAALAFHRFDPTRSRSLQTPSGKGWLRRLDLLTRPVGRRVGSVFLAGSRRTHGLSRAVLSDAALTLQNNPLGGVALLATVVLSLLAPLSLVARLLMPLAVAAWAILIAGISNREQRAGTVDIIGTVPRLADRYLLWKLGVSLLLGFGFTLVGILKLSVVAPGSALSLLGGTLLVASAATALGSLAGTPKAFIVLFLSFWYVSLNDGGNTPALDFAGFFGTADTGVRLFYLVLAIALLLLAQLVYRARAR